MLGTPEPKVSAGQEFYRVGFGHAPTVTSFSDELAEEGMIRSVTNLSMGIYMDLNDCSSAIENGITSSLGISSTRETDFNGVESETQLKIDASNALRTERNDISIQIFGIRKIIGEENNRIDKLEHFGSSWNILSEVDQCSMILLNFKSLWEPFGGLIPIHFYAPNRLNF